MDPELRALLDMLGLSRPPQPAPTYSPAPPIQGTGQVATGPAVAGTMDTGAFSPYQPPKTPIQSNAGSGRAPTDTRPVGAGSSRVQDDRFSGQSGASAAPANYGQRTQMGSTPPSGPDVGQWPQMVGRQALENASQIGGFMDRVFGGAPSAAAGGLWDKIQLLFSAGGEGWQDVARRMDEAGVPLPDEFTMLRDRAVAGPPTGPNNFQQMTGIGTPVAAAPAPAPQAAPPAPTAPQAGGGMGLIDMMMGKFPTTGLGQILAGGNLVAPGQVSPGMRDTTVQPPSAPVSVATAPATGAAAVNQVASNPGTPPLPPKPAIPIPQAAPPPLANEPLTASEQANLAAVSGPSTGQTAANALKAGLKAASGSAGGAQAPAAPSGGRITAPQQVDVASILKQLLGVDSGVPRAPNPLIGADLR